MTSFKINQAGKSLLNQWKKDKAILDKYIKLEKGEYLMVSIPVHKELYHICSMLTIIDEDYGGEICTEDIEDELGIPTDGMELLQPYLREIY